MTSLRLMRKQDIAKENYMPSETGMAYLLNSPVILLILVVYAYPILYSFWISLHRWRLTTPGDRRFIGLKSYIDVLSSSEFWDALKVTFFFTVLALTTILIASTIISLILNEQFKGRGVARAMILIPWAIPPVVNGLMWKWIFDGKLGVFNGLLYTLGLINSYQSWLMKAGFTIPILAFAQSVTDTAFASIILLGAIQSIPSDLYDAAKVDRAGVLARFVHITLPWLIQPYLVVIILATMSALRAFDVIYAMTGGGPGTASTTLSWYTYNISFRFMDFGKGCTYGYILAAITAVLALIYIKVLYKRGEIAL
jgi:multiple sugar transport system permease protein